MLRFLALFTLVGCPALSETYMSDGFGIVPISVLSDERAAWAGLQGMGRTQIVPAGQTTSVLLFIGPKALVAGQDDGHAAALAFDAHGNLVQDENATFSLEGNRVLRSSVVDGIADVLFRPAPVSGTYAGGVSIADMQSTRVLFRVTADLASVKPDWDGDPAIRAEMFSTISSTPLQDRYGNAVEDGVGTSVLLGHQTGETSVLFAPVREEKAETIVLGRGLGAGGSIELNLATASASDTFDFWTVQARTSPQLHIWDVPELSAIRLRLGPVTTAAGHLLTDGAPVEITLSGKDRSSVQARGWLQDGYFEALVQRPSFGNTLTASFTTAVGSETRDVTVGRSAPGDIMRAE